MDGHGLVLDATDSGIYHLEYSNTCFLGLVLNGVLLLCCALLFVASFLFVCITKHIDTDLCSTLYSTTLQAIQKYLINEFGAKSIPSITRALKKGVADEVGLCRQSRLCIFFFFEVLTLPRAVVIVGVAFVSEETKVLGSGRRGSAC